MNATNSRLQLRPLGLHDENAFLDGHRRMMESDGFQFALNYEEDMAWSDYVQRMQDMNKGINMLEGLVPDSFGILPEHRRKGYATEVLRQALDVARNIGIRRILLCCADDNAGSIKVIERCGGVLEAVIDVDGGKLRRYWFS